MKNKNGLSLTFAALFENGWGWLVPYLLIYVYSWKLDALTTAQVLFIFQIFHISFLTLLACFFISKFKTFSKESLLFFGFLFLFFYLPGAYLEFPSDPWMHFWRIFRWQNMLIFAGHESANKFAYFWGYTTMSWVPILRHRMALDFYSAFSQLFLSYQIFRLSLRLGFSRRWSYLQTFSFAIFFGTNIFGMRYYALSSTLLALGGYFAFLELTLDSSRKIKAKILPLFLLLFLICFNHAEEILLLFISLSALFLFWVYQNLKEANKSIFIKICFAVVFIQILTGFFIKSFFPELYADIGLFQISPFGGFKVWHDGYRFRDTLGAHGLLGILFALLYFKKNPKLGLLTLFPTAACLLPWTTIFLICVLRASPDTAGVAYRVLYAFPASFALVFGLQNLTRYLSERYQFKHAIYFAPLIVLALAWSPEKPWRGRLFFQTLKVPESRSMKQLALTADWLKKKFWIGMETQIVSDPITMYVLSCHLGLARGPLYGFSSSMDIIKSPEDLNHFINTKGPRLALVGKPELAPESSPSLVAELSHHWSSDDGDLKKSFLNFSNFEGVLIQKKWPLEDAPPFYKAYIP